jgi:hypothetical protein
MSHGVQSDIDSDSGVPSKNLRFFAPNDSAFRKAFKQELILWKKIKQTGSPMIGGLHSCKSFIQLASVTTEIRAVLWRSELVESMNIHADALHINEVLLYKDCRVRRLINFDWVVHVRRGSKSLCDSSEHWGGPKGVEVEQWSLTFEWLIVGR